MNANLFCWNSLITGSPITTFSPTIIYSMCHCQADLSFPLSKNLMIFLEDNMAPIWGQIAHLKFCLCHFLGLFFQASNFFPPNFKMGIIIIINQLRISHSVWIHLSILSQICQLPGKVNIVITNLRTERLGLGGRWIAYHSKTRCFSCLWVSQMLNILKICSSDCYRWEHIRVILRAYWFGAQVVSYRC